MVEFKTGTTALHAVAQDGEYPPPYGLRLSTARGGFKPRRHRTLTLINTKEARYV